MAEMVPLPGVGRKTANVVLGHAYGIEEGIAVDTHVLRVSNRLGIAEGDDPLRVEAQLMGLVPRERWTRTTDLLIFHGRKICDARRPRCGECPLFALCAWDSRQAWAATGPRAFRPARPARAARKAAGIGAQPPRAKAAARTVRRPAARPERPRGGGGRRSSR
jgi:endonuclease-3